MKRTAAPLENFAVGGACVVAYVTCAAFTILTDQNLMQGGDGNGVHPSLEVLYQPWELANGGYSGLVCISVILSWVIFLCYVACTAGYERFKARLDGRGSGMGDLFHTAMFLIILFDGYANFTYAKIFPNPFWQWFVALLIGFVLFFLGPFGWDKIMEGIEEMRS